MFPNTMAIGRATKSALSFAALVLMSVGFISSPAHAKKNCSAYTVTIGTQVFSGKQTVVVPAAQIKGQIAHVQGKFTDFFVNMNNFVVRNYTLSGTRVFNSKTPNIHAVLTSDLFLKLNNEQLVLERDGDGEDQSLKVQAKDCDQGGAFQMEPDTAGTEGNVLGPGDIHYCLLDSVSGRLFFTNGPLLGYDSPQLAQNTGWSVKKSTWSVDAGGRIGMVTGEDAEQALAATNNGASCGR